MSVISPMHVDYPIKDLQQHPVKDAPGSDNSKYLKSPAHAPPQAPAARGVQSDKASPENLQITIHPPDYRFYSMSGTLYSTTPGPIRMASGRNRRRKLTVSPGTSRPRFGDHRRHCRRTT
ncbi:hypothetical protein L3X38_044882 [Prunus dulcis]|uniref:Uncharacterized protein n=1 Tax=Prunus dulcis TaxID=3755 RepID=A0AAD4V1B6_PRUDU|nr:hypothetical protein L3X38_044882 [Prunus dulcis]